MKHLHKLQKSRRSNRVTDLRPAVAKSGGGLGSVKNPGEPNCKNDRSGNGAEDADEADEVVRIGAKPEIRNLFCIDLARRDHLGLCYPNQEEEDAAYQSHSTDKQNEWIHYNLQLSV